MKTLGEFTAIYEETQKEDNFLMLSRSQKRHQEVDKSLKVLPKMQFNRVFGEFRRDIEISQIAKTVQILTSAKRKRSPYKGVEINTSHEINTSVAGPATSVVGQPKVAFGRSTDPGSTRNSQHNQSILSNQGKD